MIASNRRLPSGRVLILGEDTRSFLAVVRSLGRSGLDVHVGNAPPESPSLRSRYIKYAHELPLYHAGETAWIDKLNELVKMWDFDLVIPCHDSSIVPLQSNRRRLEKPERFYLVSDEAFEVFFDKIKTYGLANKLAVRVPRQRVINSKRELQDVASELGFPLVLKPPSSVKGDSPALRREVRKFRNLDEICDLSEEDLGSDFAAQENFVGIGVGVELLALQGEILTAFQHERVHEAPTGGISGYRKSVPLDPELLDAARLLVSSVRYTGVCMIEFKRNPCSGDWVLIEINARFWGSLPLSVAAGIDFPSYLYQMLCLGTRQFPASYHYDRYARNWLIDAYWFRANMRADHADPTLITVANSRIVHEFGNLLLFRESNDTLKLYDPVPGLAEIWLEITDRLRQRYRKLSIPRYLLEKRATLALTNARNVLFVCYGNICRSPFAEALMRKDGANAREYRSAGFHPIDSRPSPPLAVNAAMEVGIPLEAHRSATINERLVQWADVVFIFDSSHEKTFNSQFPRFKDKVHYLGALNKSCPLEIHDPYGQDPGLFKSCFAHIRSVIEIAIARTKREL